MMAAASSLSSSRSGIVVVTGDGGFLSISFAVCRGCGCLGFCVDDVTVRVVGVARLNASIPPTVQDGREVSKPRLSLRWQNRIRHGEPCRSCHV